MSNPVTIGSQTHLRSLYRSVLRELPPRPLFSRSPLHQRIRSLLASPPSTSNSSGATIPVRQAQEMEQFIQYVKSQRMYVTLLERYNPGMNMDEEERTQLTAKRVGMEMPEEYKLKQ